MTLPRPRDPVLDEAIIAATRSRSVRGGFTTMTIADIAVDAGVSRPTIYRRWPTTLALTVDALDWGFRAQRDSHPAADLMRLDAREAFTEAVRRTDPRYSNPDAMVLIGNFMSEALRTPELLAVFRRHAVEPRVELVETILAGLQERGEVRDDVDRHTVATLWGACHQSELRPINVSGCPCRSVTAPSSFSRGPRVRRTRDEHCVRRMSTGLAFG